MGTRERLWDLLRRAQGIVRLERRLIELRSQLEALEGQVAAMRLQLETLGSELGTAGRHVQAVEETAATTHRFLTGETHRVLRAIAAEDADNRRRLWRARADPGYERAFDDPEPLVSVVIPTFNRPELLAERSLPSILTQSYERLEVLVIGDDAGEEVERAVRGISDPRLSFHNLSQRLTPAPEQLKHWYVQSVMPRNEGFRLARGSWLVTFDDDDLMYEDGVARLLEAARTHRAEVAYGRFRMVRPEATVEAGEFPPTVGQFTWQSGICHSAVRFFERELFAADFDQPNDYFLADTMLRAGVRFTMIPDVICDLYPSDRAWE